MAKKNLTDEELATYEELNCDVLNQPEIPICRSDAPFGRVYYQYEEEFKNREFLPSPTTILQCLEKGIGFQKWLCSHTWDSSRDYANARAWIGTMTHVLCSHLLWRNKVVFKNGYYNEHTGKVEPIPFEVQLRLNGFVNFLKDINPTPLGSEIMLYTNDKAKIDGKEYYKYPFAGTLDFLFYANIDGKGERLIYCDLKTGKEHKREHELQCTAYKILFDYIYGQKYGTIDEIGCLYINNKGRCKWQPYRFVPDAWYSVYDVFKYLNSDLRGNLPKVKEKPEMPEEYFWDTITKESSDE